MDVSIIIVNYNTRKMTQECIESIYTHVKDIDFEIILVDNASSDDSKVWFSADKRIKYIYLNENNGFGIANNIGSTVATGKYLFFLNSDTLLLNNVFSYFIAYFETNSNIGALGSYLLDKNHQYIHSYGSFITIKRELKHTLNKYFEKLHILSKKSNSKFTNTAKRVEYITGADLFMTSKTFESLGKFDSKFFMYCEEVDLQKRLEMKGLQRIIIPGPKIIHLEGASDRSHKIWSTKKYHNVLVSKAYYISKWNNPILSRVFCIINTLLLLPGIIGRNDTIKNKCKILKGALGFSNPITN